MARSLIVELTPPAAGHPVIGLRHLDRLRILASDMRPGPAARGDQPLPAHARAGHAQRPEQMLANRVGIALAGDLLDDLGRGVIGDVLIGPAASRRADRVELVERGAKEARVHPVLELAVVGMAEQAEPMRQQVGDGRLLLVAGRQPERRRISGDRLVERELAAVGEQGDHVAGDALGERGPAEDGVGGDRLAASGDGLAIALEEADLALLDHSDGEADHPLAAHQRLQARRRDACSRRRCRAPAGAPRCWRAARWRCRAPARPEGFGS